MTVAKTIPVLRQFVEEGGAIVAVSDAVNIAYQFKLPLADQMVERTPAGSMRPLPSEKYFVPGSLVTAAVDNTNPLAYGMPDRVDVFFNRSPVFRLQDDAAAKGVKVVAWYPNDKPVRSGWGWGQAFLKDGIAAAEVPLGKGKLFLLCPEVTFRGESHGTFPFFFNAIYYGQAQSVILGKSGN